MNYETYQTIRGYCWQDLGDFIDGQARNLASVIGGELDVMKYERDAAMELYQCSDLTPRERAAAHLLAVASNHRAIAWQREDDSPGGVPAAPLEPWQAAQLDRQTSEALTKYGAFIPEREAVALLTPTAAPVLVAAPGQDTATPAPAQTAVPDWQLKPPPERLPGYRWPLYQCLETMHKAGKSRPTAHDVLSAWQANPPDGLSVSGTRVLALNYTIQTGNLKTTDKKAIQTGIDSLILSI